MGERESSIGITEDAFDNEDHSNKNKLEGFEYDSDYSVAWEVSKRIIPIDDKFNERKIDRNEYFKQLESLRDGLIEQNKSRPEDQEIIELVYNGGLAVHSTCKRFQTNVEKKKENLALVQAKWQIQVATYFCHHRLKPATVAITNLFLERMRDTYETLNFDDSEADGLIRGERGLIAMMVALSKKGHDILLPADEEELDEFAKEDAELKTDLKTIGPDGVRYFWQIKTEAVDRAPLVLEINKKYPYDPDNKKFVKDVNILFDHAREAEAKDGLTTQAMYIILPEPQISSNFEPRKPITDSI